MLQAFDSLAAIVELAVGRSRAALLRAVHEYLARRREEQVDDQLARGYAAEPPGAKSWARRRRVHADWRRATLTGDAPRRGDLWLAELDKLRPVAVMHRDFAGRVLSAVLVVPLTTRIRNIPTEVKLGVDDGLDRDCVAPLDNMTLAAKTDLVRRIGGLTEAADLTALTCS